MPDQEPLPQSQRELIELEVKRAIAGEVEAYRKTVEGYQAYIERTTNWFTKGVGVVAVAATGMFYFFFGHSIPEAVKNSVSEMEVVTTAKNQLTNQISIFTRNEVGSATNQIASAAIRYIDELKQTTLRTEVEKAVAHFPVQSLTNLIRTVPPGTIAAYGGEGILPESGWLLCDGSVVQRDQYKGLFKAIGTAWGSGDGLNTFSLPDLRGEFLRGVDPQGTNDPDFQKRMNYQGLVVGPVVGSFQPDAIKSHTHTMLGGFFNGFGGGGGSGYGGAGTGGITDTNAGGRPETRPKNAYVYYIIKY